MLFCKEKKSKKMIDSKIFYSLNKFKLLPSLLVVYSKVRLNSLQSLVSKYNYC